ncbi:MAG: DUF885 domain-containing protein [Candidatus Coatesbacteria bacterium]|nr:MAG: DUF885 domain-containing protein [Candidatus Coatesbacteria bacterium]
MSTKLEKLVEEYLEEDRKLNPVSSTFEGIHDYDDLWDDYGPEGLERYLAHYVDWRGKFDGAADDLGPTEGIDLDYLRSSFTSKELYFRELDVLGKNPLWAVNTVIYGLYIMLVRNYAPAAERAESVVARLESVPAFLEGAKKSLKGPVELYTNIVSEMIDSGSGFVGTVLPEAFAGTPSGGRIADAGPKAAQALLDFVAYAKGLSQSPDYAAGTEVFDALLTEVHLLDYDADGLLNFGREMFDAINGQMAELADKIEPGAAPGDILARLKENRPTADEVLDFYVDLMNQTKQFVIDNGIVTIPSNEVLEVVETPEFERSTIPFAAYMPPAPYEDDQRGFFYVTPVDPEAPEDEIEQKLKGHFKNKALITALHEGYPGHHLQICVANAHPNPVRKESGSTVFIEGWALYCEEMLREQGLYTDDETVLVQKRDKLWRAARVIIDASLHTGRMTYDEAVAFLVENVKMEPITAEAEVKRYSYTPTQPMSYLVGEYEIYKILEKYRTANPDATLKEFHDELISHGSLPPALVGREMVG